MSDCGVDGRVHKEPIRTLSLEDFVMILPEECGGGSAGGEEEYCLDPDATR